MAQQGPRKQSQATGAAATCGSGLWGVRGVGADFPRSEIAAAVPCSVVSDSFVMLGLQSSSFCVRGILQARTQKWVAMSFSMGSSQPRDQTQVLLHC